MTTSIAKEKTKTTPAKVHSKAPVARHARQSRRWLAQLVVSSQSAALPAAVPQSPSGWRSVRFRFERGS
jgi:hypothetical protein